MGDPDEAIRSGARTPPRRESVLLPKRDELVVGDHYWMQDDTGNEVWRLAEVLELGHAGDVRIKLEGGGVEDIDPVRARAATHSLLFHS